MSCLNLHNMEKEKTHVYRSIDLVVDDYKALGEISCPLLRMIAMRLADSEGMKAKRIGGHTFNIISARKEVVATLHIDLYGSIKLKVYDMGVSIPEHFEEMEESIVMTYDYLEKFVSTMGVATSVVYCLASLILLGYLVSCTMEYFTFSLWVIILLICAPIAVRFMMTAGIDSWVKKVGYK